MYTFCFLITNINIFGTKFNMPSIRNKKKTTTTTNIEMNEEWIKKK